MKDYNNEIINDSCIVDGEPDFSKIGYDEAVSWYYTNRSLCDDQIRYNFIERYFSEYLPEGWTFDSFGMHTTGDLWIYGVGFNINEGVLEATTIKKIFWCLHDIEKIENIFRDVSEKLSFTN